jgi:hypothetical protein
MAEYIVPASLCPTCGYVMDLCLVVGGRPAPGDITGCLKCGQPLVYGDDMQVRRMTVAEHHALAPEQRRDLAKVQSFAETGWYNK